jgi:endonuclease/exonuclease/phosphatase family metal-dependent hydrolase
MKLRRRTAEIKHHTNWRLSLPSASFNKAAEAERDRHFLSGTIDFHILHAGVLILAKVVLRLRGTQLSDHLPLLLISSTVRLRD